MFGSIGMPELIIILVIALIIFGPRKLPELGKSLGKSINEFKKASTELQNTLEQEIKLEEQKDEKARAATVPPPPTGARRRRHARPAGLAQRRRQLAAAPWPWFRSRRRRRTSPPSAITTAAGRPSRPRSDDALDGRMSFLDHLDELRKRLTHAIVALLVGFVGAFAFAGQAQEFVMKPLLATLPPGGTFVYTEPGEQFFLFIKIAAIVGLLIASPYVMLQVWLFVAPGLYANEKKLAVPFVFFSSALFLAGAAFSHYLAFPMAFSVLRQLLDAARSCFMPRIAPVFSMYAWLLLAMGVMFQLPMLVMVLARLGPGDRRVPGPQHQVRDPDHLRRRGRGLTGRRPGEPDRHRRARCSCST